MSRNAIDGLTGQKTRKNKDAMAPEYWRELKAKGYGYVAAPRDLNSWLAHRLSLLPATRKVRTENTRILDIDPDGKRIQWRNDKHRRCERRAKGITHRQQKRERMEGLRNWMVRMPALGERA